ncbi:MAG: DHA2 family efflux MFS transporter permease subunit [Actinobacteria bacterium]|nr:DHA2 family efflux MFS transporter permease subunit [Actinomycetota bacterium]
MTSGEGHPRRWAILGVLVVSLLIVVLDNTVLNIALPTIQHDLNATQGELVWAVDSYILAFASLLFTWGVLGDRFGRKKVLLIGLTVFGIASMICAFSESAGMLIGFRALMGVGGAAVLPTTLAIITVVFPPHERGKAIGLWAGAVGAAVALGPVLGGLLLEHPDWSSWLTGNDWGSVFLINVPIVLIGIIAIVRIVPETRNPQPRRLDVLGLVISVAGLVLLVYGIIHASETKDWLAASVLIPVIAGILIIALFLVLEARSDHSSFDVSLFRNRGYAVSLVAVSFSFFALSGITFSLPFYLQILRGYSTLVAGLCFVPFAVGQLLAAPRSARMVALFGYRAVMTTGLVLVTLSLLGLATLRIDSPLWFLLVIFFVFGFGMGNVIAPGSTVMQNVLPLARAGAGSAVQNTVRQVFGALGVAIIGTILATQYSSNLRPVLERLPSVVPDAAKEAASESIIATVTVLGQVSEAGLPASVAAQAQAGAFDAFLSASHLTSLISMTIVGLAAIIVGFLLPHITPPTKPIENGIAPAPGSPADALVIGEAESYVDEAGGEYSQDPRRSGE